MTGKAAEPPEQGRSSSASASFTSDKPYHIASSRTLNIAGGGQAASPFAPGQSDASNLPVGSQLINPDSASSEDAPNDSSIITRRSGQYDVAPPLLPISEYQLGISNSPHRLQPTRTQPSS